MSGDEPPSKRAKEKEKITEDEEEMPVYMQLCFPNFFWEYCLDCATLHTPIHLLIPSWTSWDPELPCPLSAPEQEQV
jgi:hypothetical protein